MKTLLLVCFVSSFAHADLQSDFVERMQAAKPQKATEPPKIKSAMNLIEKKVGAAVEDSQILPTDPFALNLDPQKFTTYINQLIYVKFKNKTLCRAQLATYQQQTLYNSLKVLCLDEQNKIQTFQETL